MNQNISQIISHFGTQGKTAQALGCSQTTVFKWLHDKMNITPLYAIKVEKLTGGKFKAVDLCPRLAELENLESIVQAQKPPSAN